MLSIPKQKDNKRIKKFAKFICKNVYQQKRITEQLIDEW